MDFMVNISTHWGILESPRWYQTCTHSNDQCPKRLHNQICTCTNCNTSGQSCILDVFLIIPREAIRNSFSTDWKHRHDGNYHNKFVLFMSCSRDSKWCKYTGTQWKICIENCSVLGFSRCCCSRIETWPKHPEEHCPNQGEHIWCSPRGLRIKTV